MSHKTLGAGENGESRDLGWSPKESLWKAGRQRSQLTAGLDDGLGSWVSGANKQKHTGLPG